jgi:sugar lactone lactonase YvrE/glucose/arabinose dehydrogenase
MMRLIPLTLCLAALILAGLIGAGGPSAAAPSPASPAGVQQAGPDPATITVTTERLVTGLSRPVAIANAGDGSGRLFVIEKNEGRVRIIKNGQLLPRAFLDIKNKIDANGNEKGLLGIAFHPDYKTNGIFYVNYTAPKDTGASGDNVTKITRFKVSANNPDIADESSETLIIDYDQPYQNHNGGHLLFGPDGYLYIGTGDGGDGGDPQNRAQNRFLLLGKMLRIAVDPAEPDGGYTVPPTNPYASSVEPGTGFRPEIWAYGLRNPWRYSFDSATGDLYIGDVGQNAQEEIDFQPAASKGGENYGWRIMEGDTCHNPRNNCDRSGLTLPIFTYSRNDGVSVTGGEVYRGEASPEVHGAYFFADYGSGHIWASSRNAEGAWRTAKVGAAPRGQVSTFGVDENGEIYMAYDSRGEIHRLIARVGAPTPATPTPTSTITFDPGTRTPTPSATNPPPSRTPTSGTPVEPPPSRTPPSTSGTPVEPPPSRTPTSGTPVEPSPTLPPSGLIKPGATFVEQPGTYTFTEGPAVDARGDIYFSDVRQSRIHKWTWSSGAIALHRENTGGSNGLYLDAQGRIVVCESTGQRIVRDDLVGGVTVLTDRFNGQPYNAPNDLWIAPDGGVYFSDPAYGLQPGSLPQDGEHVYLIPPDGSAVRRVTTDLSRPNGLIGTEDGRTLYIADPGQNRIMRYAVGADGSLTGATVFVPNRGADGMTMDERGNVYLANQQSIWVYAPDGRMIEQIPVPEAPTNLTFGGKDFTTLFVTARTSVFTLEMAVRGGHVPAVVPAPAWVIRLPALFKEFLRP